MKHCKECGKTEDQVGKWIMAEVDPGTDLCDVDTNKLLNEIIKKQTYDVILEKYRGQLLDIKSKELKTFDKSIADFLKDESQPKEIRRAVSYFYMKLHVLENDFMR